MSQGSRGSRNTRYIPQGNIPDQLGAENPNHEDAAFLVHEVQLLQENIIYLNRLLDDLNKGLTPGEIEILYPGDGRANADDVYGLLRQRERLLNMYRRTHTERYHQYIPRVNTSRPNSQIAGAAGQAGSVSSRGSGLEGGYEVSSKRNRSSSNSPVNSQGAGGQNFAVLSAPRAAAVRAAQEREHAARMARLDPKGKRGAHEHKLPRFGKKIRRKMDHPRANNYTRTIIINARRSPINNPEKLQTYKDEYSNLTRNQLKIELRNLRIQRDHLENEDVEFHLRYRFFNAQPPIEDSNYGILEPIYERIVVLNELLDGTQLNQFYLTRDGGGQGFNGEGTQDASARSRSPIRNSQPGGTQDASFGKKRFGENQKGKVRRLKSDLNKLKKI